MKEHLKCSDGSPVVDDVAKTDLVNEYFAVFLPQRIATSSKPKFEPVF